ncbi:MAG: 2OG-Fe(II) oxygenase family protein [Pseudomonadota bacterium]
MSIPIIDLQNCHSQELSNACRDFGFFVLQGHDLTPALRSRAMSKIQAFFDQPKSIKNLIRRSDANCWGYFDNELTKNRQDWKEILDIGEVETEGPMAGANPQWPEDAEFVEAVQALRRVLHDTSIEVTRLVLNTFDAEVDLRDAFAKHTSFLRLNFYPPCPTPYNPQQHGSDVRAGELGISHHTDAGAMTVLVQDEHPGLQVQHRDHWIDVPAQPDALIINIGDVVQVWSNDLYPAPVHRVLANDSFSRISVPYFLNPAYEYSYAPLVNHQTPRYSPINWGHFRAGRSAGDYADNGAEIQISDFKIA